MDRLLARNGLTLLELCEGFALSRQAVAKHLRILEAANLVSVQRSGREKLHTLNVEPIQHIYDRWIGKFDRDRVAALADLKRALEKKDV